MPKVAIFDVFYVLTRKLIFFLLILKKFLESAGPKTPLKTNYEVFITPKQSAPGVKRRALPQFLNFQNQTILILFVKQIKSTENAETDRVNPLVLKQWLIWEKIEI